MMRFFEKTDLRVTIPQQTEVTAEEKTESTDVRQYGHKLYPDDVIHWEGLSLANYLLLLNHYPQEQQAQIQIYVYSPEIEAPALYLTANEFMQLTTQLKEVSDATTAQTLVHQFIDTYETYLAQTRYEAEIEAEMEAFALQMEEEASEQTSYGYPGH